MRHLTIRLATVLVAGILLMAGSVARAAEMKVSIDNFTFSPAEIEVPVGSRVTWPNNDDIPHTVTDADNPRSIRSPALDTGDSYSRVFATSGTFHYFCSLHPHMQGTVVVR